MIREGLNKVSSGSRNVLIICACVMFCVVIATVISIEHITNDPNAALGIITLVFAFYGTTLASMAALIKGEATKQHVEQIHEATDKLLNGELEAKIKKVVSEVLRTWLTDETRRPRT